MKKTIIILLVLCLGFVGSYITYGYYMPKLSMISIENIIIRTVHKGIRVHNKMVKSIQPTIDEYVNYYNTSQFDYICKNLFESKNLDKCKKQLEFAKFDLGNIENHDLKQASILLNMKKINLYEYVVKTSVQYQNKKDVDMQFYILFNKKLNEFKMNEIIFDELDIY